VTFNPFSALTAKIVTGIALAALLWGAFTTIDRNQWRAAARASDAALAKVGPAQELALAAARKAIADTEARYKEKANVAEASHSVAVAAARTDADRYLSAHRVPACPGGATRSATTKPEGGDPRLSPDLSAVALVADADVRACSAAAAYALAAHGWALTLNDPQ
jgi:hypothetical protein